MISETAVHAIDDALHVGKALLKFITPNEVGRTGSHQCGFYLPRSEWELFTPHKPEVGFTLDSFPRVFWHDGRETESRVIWYGKKQSNERPNPEFRLTRFGRDFPWLREEMVGALLCLVPESHEAFRAYVLESEEDIEEIQISLGLEIRKRFAVYREHREVLETQDECIERQFAAFTSELTEFPTGQKFSEGTWKALEECLWEFGKLKSDKLLMRCIDAEYRLFRLAERKLCEPIIRQDFKKIDDFVSEAKKILNRRASRAGRSFENHAAFVMQRQGIPHQMRVTGVKGVPDMLIPGEDAYLDPDYPDDKLFTVALKTTCKDRWRQVTHEAQRLETKYLMTIQQGISTKQMDEMEAADVKLIVPKSRHRDYPKDRRNRLLSVEQFTEQVRTALG